MQAPEIYKFGGASVKDADAIRKVAAQVMQRVGSPLVVVISAMGKTTNALEALIHAHYHDRDGMDSHFQKLQEFHNSIAAELMGDQKQDLMNELHDLWVELNWILEEDPHPDYNYHYDQVIVFGELASTKIVSAYFTAKEVEHTWL